MFQHVVGLIQSDIAKQKTWASERAKFTARSITLTAGTAAAGAIFAFALLIIALMALYTWAAQMWGPLAGYGVVGGLLALTAATCLGLASFRPEPKAEPRPEMSLSDPAKMQAAVMVDLKQQGDALLGAVKRSPIGPAIMAGEQAHASGRKLTQLASEKLGIEPRPIYPVLIAAGVVGSVLLRRR